MICVLTKINMWNGGYTDPLVVGATTSLEIAERWRNTTSYIYGEMHQVDSYENDEAENLVKMAEETEKERAKKYGEGDNTGTEGTVL